jgi:hypothetical protein
MEDDSADLVIDGKSRRVAMDITELEPKAAAGGSKPPGNQTEIEGEVHDQEDLGGTDSVLDIDGCRRVQNSLSYPTPVPRGADRSVTRRTLC